MSLDVDIRHQQGDFSLEVTFRSVGRLTALFGRSGSGKTTLVNSIAGLIRPDRGRIATDGRLLVDTDQRIFVPKHRRRIGYVFQDARLFPHLSVRRNLLFGTWFTQPRGQAATLGSVVELLDIGALLDRHPSRLSGGEKQRVAIGRALLSRPDFLLMDEPLASLDEARKSEILPYIERLRDDVGIPIVYVSHSAYEVARLATTVVVLDRGRLASIGSASEIFGASLGSRLLSTDRETGTIIEGVISQQDDETVLTILSTAAGTLLVPQLQRPIGSRVRVLVGARDVMLSVVKPEGVSALNVLPGEITAVAEAVGAWREVQLRCGAAKLLARVTRKSVDDLALKPGRGVYAMIKSVTFDPERVGRFKSEGGRDGIPQHPR